MDSYCNTFAGYGCEPPIAEMLKDPIVHLVMRRDKVSEEALVELIESARRSIFHRRSVQRAQAA